MKLSLLALVLSLTAAAQSPAPVSAQKEALPTLDPVQVRIISDHEARESLGHVQINVGNESTVASPELAGVTTNAGTTLPVWSYSVKASQNGSTYSGQIVGTSALSSNTTTDIPAIIVPVIIKITQGGTTYTFDPTATDASCLGTGNTALSLTQGSPIFSNASLNINGQSEGSTQYGDAILRAEFNTTTNSNSSYHLLLNATTSTALTITVNAGFRNGNSTGTVYSVGSQCGNNGTTNRAGALAVVNINTVDAALQNYIKSHGLNASQFPFFITYNAVMSEGPANNTAYCCVLGYHNALGTPGQTYGVAEFEGRDQTVFTGVADIAAASHEVNEWINDPATTNPTPAWGNIGQVSGCQSNFEVGDPLSGTLMPTVSMPNGFTYHLQELAFYSWFYGGASLGAGGKYSSNGTFAGAANLCPPGGTN